MNTEDRLLQFDKAVGRYITDEFREWLVGNGFFVRPASVSHHGTYEGALFDQSMAVMNALVDMTDRLELKWQQERSPYIVGMFHDLCKVDNYRKSEDEQWEYNNASLLTGHGEKSVMLLQQHIRLTDEEMYCIRWHMGAFDDQKKWNNYGRAVTEYPNVLWTHTADMVAARIIGI